MDYPVKHAYLTDGPHLIYYNTDDGVHYICPACSFDQNLGFTGNTSDAIRARDAHDATPCPRRELPTGVDQADLDEAEEIRRQVTQQLHDAAEAARNQPPHTKRRMPSLEEQLLHEMTKPLTEPSSSGGFFMLPERLPPQDDDVETAKRDGALMTNKQAALIAAAILNAENGVWNKALTERLEKWLDEQP